MVTAGGSELLAHIKTGFIDAMVEGSGAAEQQLRDFHWPSVFSGDAMQAHAQLNVLNMQAHAQLNASSRAYRPLWRGTSVIGSGG